MLSRRLIDGSGSSAAPTLAPTPVSCISYPPSRWTAFAVDQTGDKFLCVAYAAGIFLTTNGYDFTQTALFTDVLKEYIGTSGGTCAAAMSADGSVCAVLFGYGSVVYVSTNGGSAWSANPLPGSLGSASLAMSADGSTLYATSNSVGGYWKSTDYGATWNAMQVSPPPGAAWLVDAIHCSADGQEVVVATATTLYLSSNGGSTWTVKANPGGASSIFRAALSRNGSNLCFLGYVGGTTKWVFSSDFGETWTIANYGMTGSNLNSLRYSVADSNLVVAAFGYKNTNDGLWLSFNNASTWTRWLYDPSFGPCTNAVVATHLGGGIGMKGYAGFECGAFSGNYSTGMLVKFGYPANSYSNYNARLSPAAFADGATCISGDGTKIFALRSYIATQAAASYTQISVAEYQSGGLGENLALAGNITVPNAYPPARLLSSTDGSKMIALRNAAASYMTYSSNGGFNWSILSGAGSRFWGPGAASQDLSRIVACDMGPGYIYTSSNTGSSWTTRMGAGSKTWIGACMSDDGATLFAVCNENTGIWRSTNSGANWSNIIPDSSNSSAYFNWVVCSSNGQTVYAGAAGGLAAKKGIYKSTDGGSNWTLLTGTVIAPTSVRLQGGACCSTDGGKVLHVVDNTVWHTSGGGLGWSAVAGPYGASIAGISMSADGAKAVVTLAPGRMFILQ